jgi:uncharacterized protein (DUF2267 family)
VNYQEFLRTETARGVPADKAEDLACATLQTLSERITGGEARDLAAQLPKPLQHCLQREDEPAEAFGIDEFLRRISERAGVDEGAAREAAQAVLTTVRDAITPGELDDVASQLPAEFRALVGAPS